MAERKKKKLKVNVERTKNGVYVAQVGGGAMRFEERDLILLRAKVTKAVAFMQETSEQELVVDEVMGESTKAPDAQLEILLAGRTAFKTKLTRIAQGMRQTAGELQAAGGKMPMLRHAKEIEDLLKKI